MIRWCVLLVLVLVCCCSTGLTAAETIHPTESSSPEPSSQPTTLPTGQPSGEPSDQPTCQPSREPTLQPASRPSHSPTGQPSRTPSSQPVGRPSRRPSGQPSRQPSRQPMGRPSRRPTGQPSHRPSRQPSARPSRRPTGQPTRRPTGQPSIQPTSQPTRQPSGHPTRQPTSQPTILPTNPTGKPSHRPTRQPTRQPSSQPSAQPSRQPTSFPTMHTETTLRANCSLIFVNIKPNFQTFKGNENARVAIKQVLQKLFPTFSGCIIRGCFSIQFVRYSQYSMSSSLGRHRELTTTVAATVTMEISIITEFLRKSDYKGAFLAIQDKVIDELLSGRLTSEMRLGDQSLELVSFPFLPIWTDAKLVQVKTIPPTSRPSSTPTAFPSYKPFNKTTKSIHYIVLAATLCSALVLLGLSFSYIYFRRNKIWFCHYPQKIADEMTSTTTEKLGKLRVGKVAPDFDTDDEEGKEKDEDYLRTHISSFARNSYHTLGISRKIELQRRQAEAAVLRLPPFEFKSSAGKGFV